jgi:hypothetical protein
MEESSGSGLGGCTDWQKRTRITTTEDVSMSKAIRRGAPVDMSIAGRGRVSSIAEANTSLPRRNFLRNGVLAVGAGLASMAVTRKASAALQDGWWFCNNCTGLYAPGAPGHNVCPDGGNPHDSTRDGTFDYFLPYALPPDHNLQQGWYWCYHCAGLFYPGTGLNVCPGNSNRSHASSGSFHYALYYSGAGIGNQPDWYFCDYCAVLWFGGTTARDVVNFCPVNGFGGHNKSISFNYNLYAI